MPTVLFTILPAVSTVVVTKFPAVSAVFVMVFPAASTVFPNTSPVSFKPVSATSPILSAVSAAAPAHVPGDPAALYNSSGVYFFPLQSTISPFVLIDKLHPDEAGQAGQAGHTGGITSVFNI